MNTRQWKTYELIKNNSLHGKVTTQLEIVENYPYCSTDLFGERKLNPDGYNWNTNPKVHDHCSMVWQDIEAINSDDTIQKIIVSPKPWEYKLAETPEEVKEYCRKKFYKPAMAKLIRQSKMLAKVKLDGQGRLLFKDKTQARDYWETFLKDSVNDLVEMSDIENETDNTSVQ